MAAAYFCRFSPLRLCRIRSSISLHIDHQPSPLLDALYFTLHYILYIFCVFFTYFVHLYHVYIELNMICHIDHQPSPLLDALYISIVVYVICTYFTHFEYCTLCSSQTSLHVANHTHIMHIAIANV